MPMTNRELALVLINIGYQVAELALIILDDNGRQKIAEQKKGYKLPKNSSAIKAIAKNKSLSPQQKLQAAHNLKINTLAKQRQLDDITLASTQLSNDDMALALHNAHRDSEEPYRFR
jgi:hypothetical protein